MTHVCHEKKKIRQYTKDDCFISCEHFGVQMRIASKDVSNLFLFNIRRKINKK